LKVWNFQT